jgi:hypothetical protein
LKFFDNKDLQFMQQMVYSSALMNSHFNGKKPSMSASRRHHGKGSRGSSIPPALPYESFRASRDYEELSKNHDREFEVRIMRVLKRRSRAHVGHSSAASAGSRSPDSDLNSLQSGEDEEDGEEKNFDPYSQHISHIGDVSSASGATGIRGFTNHVNRLDRSDINASRVGLDRSSSRNNVSTSQSFVSTLEASRQHTGPSKAAVVPSGKAVNDYSQQLSEEPQPSQQAHPPRRDKEFTRSKAIDSNQPPPSFMAPTENARYRDKDLEPAIISHWRGHEEHALSQEILDKQQTTWKTTTATSLNLTNTSAVTGKSTGRRRSWDGSSLASTRTNNKSGLLTATTNLTFLRRKSWGIPLTEDVVPGDQLQNEGYFTDGGCTPSRRRSRIGAYILNSLHL